MNVPNNHSHAVQEALIEHSRPVKVLYISSYIPRKCGIATFTRDLTRGVNLLNPLYKLPRTESLRENSSCFKLTTALPTHCRGSFNICLRVISALKGGEFLGKAVIKPVSQFWTVI